MEIALIRANIEEDEEAIMARFLCSLNREIANVVELQNYVEIEDMVSMAMKVERQLKRGRPAKQKGGSYSGSSNWKSKWGASSISVEKPKSNAEMGMNRSQWDNKERDSGELETEDEESDHMPLHDDSSDCEYAAEGNALVIMQALNAQMKEEERDDVQRENIFHTRCQVKDRVYEDQFRIKISICEKSEEFGDVFSKELPNRLPPIRGIEHQIDFVPGAVILSRPAYRSNPKEIKELQRAPGARSTDKQTASQNGPTGTQGPPRSGNKLQMTFQNSTWFPEGRFSGHERLPASLRGTFTENRGHNDPRTSQDIQGTLGKPRSKVPTSSRANGLRPGAANQRSTPGQKGRQNAC
ncbi:hypothetical protein CRG98_012458 [Punica granatum]|uniref:Uncharacterized protein n=1 Tax=Punica granatum TaxID=22663 RepID=A0A2I0KFQ9_PUNGR|nr:hypothetical protein CRG98_012458 [Punica granatum]